MNVILSTPPEYRKLTTPAQVLGPPMGLMYMASYARHYEYLKKANAKLEIYDPFTEHIEKDEFVEHILQKKPDLLGITVTSRMFLVTMASLAEIHSKLPDTKIVLGGIHPTFTAKRIVESFPFIDCVIKGEAEKTFAELLVSYHDNSDISEIKGVTTIRNGSLIDNEPDTMKNLDEIPFPARDLVADVEYGYTWNGVDLTYGKFTSLVTSRGCPFTCKFCTNRMFANRSLRNRSIENIVSEMELLQEEGYKSCVIIDDIFTIDKKRVINLCKEIQERKIDLVFYCEGRVDSNDSEMFRAMRNAGFSSILFGIESGSQKILDYYKKGTTPKIAKLAVKNAKDAGLQAIGAFIIGSIIENESDVKETLEHIRELNLDGLEVNALSMAPWDPLFQKVEYDSKVNKNDWMRDHLVSEYYDNFTKDELAKHVEEAYYSFYRIGAINNVKKMIKILRNQRDARNVMLKNFFNPYVWQLVKERCKPRHKIEEILMNGNDMDFLNQKELKVLTVTKQTDNTVQFE